MPKDWESHKAELKKLYLEEDKKLLDIQRILQSRGFKASVRAYRMRFDEWDFRKNKRKHIKHNPKVPPPDRIQSAKVTDLCAVNFKHMEEMRKDSSRCTLFVDPSHHGHGTKLPILDVDSLAGDSELTSDLANESMIFVGIYLVPKQPASAVELLSYLPHSSKLQIYGLLCTWKDGTEWMETLQQLMRNRESLSMILEPQQNVRIGTTFIAADYFEVVTHCIPSLKMQFTVKEQILLAIQECDRVLPGSPSWVVAWWKANDTCAWPTALAFLRNSRAGSNISEFFMSKGHVIVGMRLLCHHYDILANDMECLHHECEHKRIHYIKDLMREYVEIIQCITGINSSGQILDTKFYVFALELSSEKEETISEEARTLRLQVEKVQQEMDGYRQVFAKHTKTDSNEVENYLDNLPAIETSGQISISRLIGVSPPNQSSIFSTQGSDILPISGIKEHLISSNEAEMNRMTTPPCTLTNYPAEFSYSWSNWFEVWERTPRFKLLLKDWTLWKLSSFGTIEFHIKFRNMDTKIQSQACRICRERLD